MGNPGGLTNDRLNLVRSSAPKQTSVDQEKTRKNCDHPEVMFQNQPLSQQERAHQKRSDWRNEGQRRSFCRPCPGQNDGKSELKQKPRKYDASEENGRPCRGLNSARHRIESQRNWDHTNRCCRERKKQQVAFLEDHMLYHTMDKKKDWKEFRKL